MFKFSDDFCASDDDSVNKENRKKSNNNNNDDDDTASVFSRLERNREELEGELGFEFFLKAYRCIKVSMGRLVLFELKFSLQIAHIFKDNLGLLGTFGMVSWV